jgi:hypothetical protein
MKQGVSGHRHLVSTMRTLVQFTRFNKVGLRGSTSRALKPIGPSHLDQGLCAGAFAAIPFLPFKSLSQNPMQ